MAPGAGPIGGNMKPHFIVGEPRNRSQYRLRGLMVVVAFAAVACAMARELTLAALVDVAVFLGVGFGAALAIVAAVASLLGFAMALGWLGFLTASLLSRMAARIRRAASWPEETS